MNQWLSDRVIAVIGLGYVGLPLAVEFSKFFPVLGFDKDEQRIAQLRSGLDITGEANSEELGKRETLRYSNNVGDLAAANVFVVSVPTPIDQNRIPNLLPLKAASGTIGSVLKPGDYVIYESTVYPGCTEEDCVPILEKESGLKYNKDFFVGYSPERINPGDSTHRLADIVKVISGSNEESAERIDALYRTIITAGTHRAPNIKTAEAAKVIENTQRDVNIALVNELSKIFERMGLDTNTVLEAARTKWNFVDFRPGLVGGHCIGVDPYYLTHKAQELGYNPEVILSGRRINDGMGKHVVERLIKAMAKRAIPVAGARILVMGLTFKENCPDLRNSRVFDILSELLEYGIEPNVWDTCCDAQEAMSKFGIDTSEPSRANFDAIILAVPHARFFEMGSGAIRKLSKSNAVFFDVKGIFDASESDLRL